MDDKNDYTLLASLSKLTGRSEDFVTDSFVHLLKRLASEEPKFLNYLLRKISGNKGNFNAKPDNIYVRSFEEFSRGRAYPDIQIEDEDNHLIIEVKVGAPIDSQQLDDYKEILNSKSKTKSLAMIIGYRDEKDLIKDVKINRWYEIALELEDRDFRGSQVTNYLIEEFLELLRYNEVYSYPALGELSTEFRNLMEKASRKPSLMENCILFQNHGSPSLLNQKDKFENLPKLYSFLGLLEQSLIEALQPKRKVKFALLGKRMMGLTSENLAYCFWIEYSDPDVLALQYYNGKIGVSDKLMHSIQPKEDEGFEFEQGKFRFYRLINLNKSKFYNFSKGDRKEFLKRELSKFKKFCEDSF